jgi:hypothetical protein
LRLRSEVEIVPESNINFPSLGRSITKDNEDGDGVEQDYALAAHWYRRAAEHVPNLGGAGQGRNSLGNLYMEGLGVPNDPVQAYMWFSLAGVDKNIASAEGK